MNDSESRVLQIDPMKPACALRLLVLLCGLICSTTALSVESNNATDHESRTGAATETTCGADESQDPAALIAAAKLDDLAAIERAIDAIKQQPGGNLALLQALRDENHYVRLAAATALCQIAQSSIVLKAIGRLRSDKDKDVRSWADAILDSIDNPKRKVVSKRKLRFNARENVSPELKPLRDIPPVPAKLKSELIAFRINDRAPPRNPPPGILVDLKVWLSQVLVKGSTRQSDVVALLGPFLEDLDRPRRDGAVTLRFSTFRSGLIQTLLFDFDAQTQVLTDWSFSAGICGLCPHVYAHDGRWRMEGKLLAGFIGVDQESTDTLLLPRLIARNGQARVLVSNIAPELEYLDRVQLGSVALKDGEELDVGHDNCPHVWTSNREYRPTFESENGSMAEHVVQVETGLAMGLLVFEVRNTSTFETDMRAYVFGERPKPASTDVQVDFDGGTSAQIRPVGTKFLRRVVVPIPSGTRRLTLRLRPEMWLVRRIWIGTGRSVEDALNWQLPHSIRAQNPEALNLLSKIDRQRLVLAPRDSVEVEFLANDVPPTSARIGYVLRMTGYYDFINELTVEEYHEIEADLSLLVSPQ